MSYEGNRNDADASQYADKAMGSPVGGGLLIRAIGRFVAPLHLAAVIR